MLEELSLAGLRIDFVGEREYTPSWQGLKGSHVVSMTTASSEKTCMLHVLSQTKRPNIPHLRLRVIFLFEVVLHKNLINIIP